MRCSMEKKKQRMKRDVNSPQWLFDKYFKMEKKSLRKLAEETGYSLSRLKELSSKHKWKQKVQIRESEKDDSDCVTLIIPRCDGSIAQVLKKPILKRIKKTKECLIEKFVLGETETLTDNTKHDSDGNVIIPDSVREFIKNKIAEQDKLREAMKKKKEKPMKKEKQKDPFQAAVDKAMEVSKADKKFYRQARFEIRRWISRYYSYSEATEKAVNTLKCGQEQSNKEEAIKKEEEKEAEKLQNTIWGSGEIKL